MPQRVRAIIALWIILGLTFPTQAFAQTGSPPVLPLESATSLSDPVDRTNIIQDGLTGAEITTVFPEIGRSEVSPRGSFTYTIPIDVPPGRKGVTPQLAIAYDSGVGNGLLGVGWRLAGLPVVTRANSGTGINFNANDSFAFSRSGWEVNASPRDLLVREPTGNAYRTKEESWQQFRPMGSCGNGPCYWEVRSQGNTWFLGGDASCHAGNYRAGSACHPDGRSWGQAEDWGPASWDYPHVAPQFRRGIRRWHLYKVVDINGNALRVDYQVDQGVSYPHRITSMLNDRAPAVPGKFFVEFSYEPRFDTSPFPNRFAKRLTAIRIASLQGGQRRQIRRYRLRYEDPPDSPSGRSRLREIRILGSDDRVETALPPLTFTYSSGGGLDNTSMQQTSGISAQPASSTAALQINGDHCDPARTIPHRAENFVGDINGDGKSDLVRYCEVLTVHPHPSNRTADQWTKGRYIYTYHGTEQGLGDPLLLLQEVVQGSYLASQEPSSWVPYLIDANGDGFSDLFLVQIGQFEGIFVEQALGSPTGLTHVGLRSRWQQQLPEPQYPSGAHPAPYRYQWNTLPLDINGDGKMDLAFVNGERFLFTALGGDAGLGPIVQQNVQGWNNIPVELSPASFMSANLNSDSKADLVLPYYGRNGFLIFSALSTGSGYGPMQRYQLETADQGARSYAPAVVDLNGDRRDDIVLMMLGKYSRNWDRGREWCRQNHPDVAESRCLLDVHSNVTDYDPSPFELRYYLGRQQPFGSPSAFDTFSRSNDFTAGTFIYNYHPMLPGWTNLHSVRTAERTGTFGDLNGDGMSDFISFYRGALGHELRWILGGVLGLPGQFEQHPQNNASPMADGDVTAYKWWSDVGDITGDGLADIGYAYSHHVGGFAYVGFAPGGQRGLGDVVEFNWSNQGGGIADVKAADVDGDGLADLIGIGKHLSDPVKVFLSRGTRGDLLTNIDNGLGGTVVVTYASTGSLPHAICPDVAACGAASNYGGPNRIPIPVVTSVEMQNGRGSRRGTTYDYVNGRYLFGAPADEEDLGFERVIAVDLQTQQKTVTSYHHARPYSGYVQKVENFDGDGVKLHERSSEYDNVETIPGVRFVRLRGETERFYEGGRYTHQTTTRRVYDAYGALLEQTECAGRDCLSQTTQYTHDAAAWLLGRVDSVKSSRPSGVILDWKQVHYRNASYWERECEMRLLCNDADKCFVNPLTRGNRCQPTTIQNDKRWVVTENNVQYDPYGNMRSHQDVTGTTTSYIFEDDFKSYIKHETTSIRKPQGQPVVLMTTSTYDFAGRPATVADVAGLLSTSIYDNHGRIQELRSPNGKVEQRRYLDFGNLQQQRLEIKVHTGLQAGWHTMEHYFDGLGRNDKTILDGDDNKKIITDFEELFVSRRRVIKRSEPHFVNQAPTWVETTFDAEDRPVAVRKRYPQGDKVVRSYEYLPLSFAVYDALGRRTKYLFDHRLILTSMVDAADQVTNYMHDEGFRTKEVRLPNGDVWRSTFDNWDRLVKLEEPASGTTTFAYYDHGKLSRRTDALGSQVTMEYDDRTRPTKRIIQTLRGREEEVYLYDNPANMPQARGKLWKATEPSGVTEYLYDSAGRIEWIQRSIQGLPSRQSEQYQYDFLDRVISKRLPNGTVLETSYSPGQHEREIKVNGQPHLLFSNYSALGQPGWRQVGGVTTGYRYNRDNFLQELRSETPRGEVLQHLEYSYDDVDNVKSMIDRRGVTTSNGINTSQTQGFEYDALDQLTRAVGVYGTEQYGYDALGNITRRGPWAFDYSRPHVITGNRGRTSLRYHFPRPLFAMASTPPKGESKTAAPTVAVDARPASGVQFFRQEPTSPCQQSLISTGEFIACFDAAGNLVERTLLGVKRTYEYDGLHRLIRIREGASQRIVVEFAYNYAGERVRKRYTPPQSTNPIDTFYVGAGYEVRGEQRGGASTSSITVHVISPLAGLVSSIVQGSLQSTPSSTDVARARGNRLSGTNVAGLPPGTWITLQDHLGTTTVAVELPAGKEATRYISTPFGLLDRDHSVGLDAVGAQFTGKQRDHESDLLYYGARYYDPFVGRFTSPDPLLPAPADSRAYNRYVYVKNNPVKLVDPTGRAPEWANAIVGFFVRIDQRQTFNPQRFLPGGRFQPPRIENPYLPPNPEVKSEFNPLASIDAAEKETGFTKGQYIADAVDASINAVEIAAAVALIVYAVGKAIQVGANKAAERAATVLERRVSAIVEREVTEATKSAATAADKAIAEAADELEELGTLAQRMKGAADEAAGVESKVKSEAEKYVEEMIDGLIEEGLLEPAERAKLIETAIQELAHGPYAK